jgi:N-acetylneuraminate synthase/sialic acid synthase
VRELTIAGQRIADDAPTWVVAEIGNTHQGDLAVAHHLIEAVARCGGAAVKFQLKTVELLYTRRVLEAPYAHEHSFGATYGAHKAHLELSDTALQACFAEARRCGIVPFATAFDELAVDRLMRLDPAAFKVHSGGVTDTPLLRCVASTGKPIIVSTGGATWADVDRVVEVLTPRCRAFALLHCTAAYPVRDVAELNLQAIAKMRDRYPGTVIGWSGHDSGIAMALLAYSLGARIIEKHVTLNRNMQGTDHAFSLEPVGLTKLVRDLRRAELAQGDGEKRRYASEDQALAKMSRTLVAAVDLRRGHILQPDDIDLKIAGEGLPPYLFEDVIGFPLACPIAEDEPITFAHLKGAISG